MKNILIRNQEKMTLYFVYKTSKIRGNYRCTNKLLGILFWYFKLGFCAGMIQKIKKIVADINLRLPFLLC